MTHEGRYVYLNHISLLFLPYLDIQLVVENELCRVGVDTKIGIKGDDDTICWRILRFPPCGHVQEVLKTILHTGHILDGQSGLVLVLWQLQSGWMEVSTPDPWYWYQHLSEWVCWVVLDIVVVVLHDGDVDLHQQHLITRVIDIGLIWPRGSHSSRCATPCPRSLASAGPRTWYWGREG